MFILGANRCLNVCIRHKCFCETYLLVLQCRETHTATLCLCKLKLVCSEGREIFFLTSLRKMVLKQRSEVVAIPREMHIPCGLAGQKEMQY